MPSEPSPAQSHNTSSSSASSSPSSSRSRSPLPEPLATGREKRATAGNKLRALLDAEFQEEEIFKEDEHDSDFERQKSDEGEAFLSSSDSDSEDENQMDEEAGEKILQAEQAAAAKRSKKRKADKSFIKPPVKRRVPPTQQKQTAVASKPTSTTSSVSNRHISFDPAVLAARRSSRALTVQITNETHERIISAAARRATLPVVPKRERTPPLTQEERLAQAVLTEEENKMSLKRIVEAEEERARKRREKLEALRRRRFDEPIVRFISIRANLIEEVEEVADAEKEDVIVEDMVIVEESSSVAVVKVETTDVPTEASESKEGERKESETNLEVTEDVGVKGEGEKMDIHRLEEKMDIVVEESPAHAKSRQSRRVGSENGSPKSTLEQNPEEMDVEMDEDLDHPKDKALLEGDNDTFPKNLTPPHPVSAATEDEKHHPSFVGEDAQADQTKPTDDTHPATVSTPKSTNEIAAEQAGIIISPQPPLPKSPAPYHHAHYTSNTLSILPLPNQPLLPVRDTFFPNIPLFPAPKPKPCAKCPITGLTARYKDPLSGVGYYDIHAFKILREVGRRGGRYVWCSEGGWFVGEMGWSGRGAKGVPEGWNG